MIFDVIKYPISIPPNENELINLPDEIFNKWVALTNWLPSYPPEYNRASITNLYREVICDTLCNFHERRNRYINELLLLRKVIQEHE